MRLHVRDHFSHPEEATVLVHTQNPAPVLGAAVVHGVVDGDARVVHQNIQPPMNPPAVSVMAVRPTDGAPPLTFKDPFSL